jgi:ammonium transporter, Amt family
VALGTLFLWVGWLFFNGGSTLGLTNTDEVGGGWLQASASMVNTILAPSSCGLLTLFLRKIITGERKEVRLDYAGFMNGILAGCVSITASCNEVHSWSAVVIGVVASFVYCFGVVLLRKLRIDDPLDAFEVHGLCGVWGIIASAIFNKDKGIVYNFESGIKLLGF